MSILKVRKGVELLCKCFVINRIVKVLFLLGGAKLFRVRLVWTGISVILVIAIIASFDVCNER